MERSRLTPEQRAELHEILHYAYGPSRSPMEHMTQRAIIHYIYGEDVVAELVSTGIQPFQAERAAYRARTYLNNARWGRRPKFAEIVAARTKRRQPRFTYQNFQYIIDDAQNKDLGMSTMAIFSLVEVFLEDEELEKDYLVNYSDFAVKEWLIKMLVWALMNKREVVIKPATEEDMNTRRVFNPKPK